MGIKVTKVHTITLECVICWDTTTYTISSESPLSYQVSDPDNFTSYGTSPRMLAEKEDIPPIFCDRCRAMAFIARWKDAEFTAEGNFTEFELKVVDIKYNEDSHFPYTRVILEQKRYEEGKLIQENTYSWSPNLFYMNIVNPKQPALNWEEVRLKEDRPAN